MISNLQKYCWINEVTGKALADKKLSNIHRHKYLTIKLWSEQNMLDRRSIKDMLVTDYSALTHCFFYGTVWLTEKVRKTNVTQPRTTTFWPYCCCVPWQARESHPLSVTPSVLQQLPLLLYFIRALNAFIHFGSDPLFYCNSPLHLRIDCSKPWSQKRGSTCPKSPHMLYRSCWEQSRYKGALTSQTNTHNISTSTREETGKTQYSTALV